jgi:hypothetical protein
MSPGSLLGLHTSVGGFSGRSGRKEDSHARQHIASVGNMDARGRVLFVGNEPNHPLRMWLMNGDGTAQCSVTPGGIELEVGECTNGDDLCRAGAWCDGADVDGRTSKRHSASWCSHRMQTTCHTCICQQYAGNTLPRFSLLGNHDSFISAGAR